MAELSFKSKQLTHNHLLPAHFRPPVPHPESRVGPDALEGNLVIHVDSYPLLNVK